jgi:bifunctional non-homologous end joining protein LigD
MATKSTRGDSPRIRPSAAQAKRANRHSPASGDSSPTVVGVRISHPDRVIYPDLGTSKIQLARYYERIGDWIVPHVAGRPLTLVHCPAGIAAPCKFLKHAKAWGPSALRRVRIQEKTKVGEYVVADSIEAVVSLAQMGIVEIHTWNSTAEDIERPNRLMWDLDPGPHVSWKEVVKAAELVRDVLTTGAALKLFRPRRSQPSRAYS